MKKERKKENFWGWIFALPTFLGLLILNIIPAIQTFFLSFQETDGFSDPKWVGLANYKRLLTDNTIPKATLNTVKYALIVVPFVVALSLLIAVLLNTKIKGISFYRVAYFLPMVAAPTAVAMVWKWMFNSQYGLINNLLSYIGIQGPKWLTDPKMTLITICIVGIWGSLGMNIIILLGGLQDIPLDYYDAAEIDGATWFRKLISITIPLVSPTLFFVGVTTLISSLQVFDTIYMMIDPKGLAMQNTQSLAYLFYRETFVYNEKGYGSVIVMVLLLLILLCTLVQMKVQKKWVTYD